VLADDDPRIEGVVEPRSDAHAALRGLDQYPAADSTAARLGWVRRSRLDIAARQRPHLPPAGGDAGKIVELADLAVREAAEGNATRHVGGRRFFQHHHRAAVGQHALAGHEIEIAQHLGGEGDAARALVDRRHTVDRVADPGDVMVLQVLSDHRQVAVEWDADPGQMLAGADTRELQDVWRADGTRRQDGLPLDLSAPDYTAAFEFNPDRALAVEQDAAHKRLGGDPEVRPLYRRMQIGVRGAGAAAAAARLLAPADAVAGGASAGRQVIHVFAVFEADLPSAGNDCGTERGGSVIRKVQSGPSLPWTSPASPSQFSAFLN
jgi:hypothetical protein